MASMSLDFLLSKKGFTNSETMRSDNAMCSLVDVEEESNMTATMF